ncbi:NADH dehydrogenase I chain C; chain D [Salmonella enterica subsp. enterica serovar Hartford]|nr:NADH dehydrogenase I chain C; chain D [Salmonella enterica subsp. enterica serovar Hartford]
MVNNMTDLTAQDAAWSTRDHLDDPVIGELRNRFGPDAFTVQATRTGIPLFGSSVNNYWRLAIS